MNRIFNKNPTKPNWIAFKNKLDFVHFFWFSPTGQMKNVNEFFSQLHMLSNCTFLAKHFEQSLFVLILVHFTFKPDSKQTRKSNFMQLSNFPTLVEQIQTLFVFCAALELRVEKFNEKSVCLFTCRCINLASLTWHICEHGNSGCFSWKKKLVMCNRMHTHFSIGSGFFVGVGRKQEKNLWKIAKQTALNSNYWELKRLKWYLHSRGKFFSLWNASAFLFGKMLIWCSPI